MPFCLRPNSGHRTARKEGLFVRHTTYAHVMRVFRSTWMPRRAAGKESKGLEDARFFDQLPSGISATPLESHMCVSLFCWCGPERAVNLALMQSWRQSKKSEAKKWSSRAWFTRSTQAWGISRVRQQIARGARVVCSRVKFNLGVSRFDELQHGRKSALRFCSHGKTGGVAISAQTDASVEHLWSRPRQMGFFQLVNISQWKSAPVKDV